jgi:hypothetical protein
MSGKSDMMRFQILAMPLILFAFCITIVSCDRNKPSSTAEQEEENFTTAQIQEILKKVGEAVLRNEEHPLPDLDMSVSLAMYLFDSFGYKQGDKVSKEILGILLKAHKFAGSCLTNDWIDGYMNINNPSEVRQLFNATFSGDELYAFANIRN